MTKLTSLSIFFPAFNEEKNIPIVIAQVLSVAPNISKKFEIIIINDGSVDGTKEVVERTTRKNKNVRLVNHKKNLGYGAALKSGFYNSKYDYITYMDSDGQFNFSQIEKLISKIGKTDIVVGFRIKRADRLIRVLNGKLWNLMVSLLLGINLKDIDCGFKLVKKEVIEKIPRLESNGATISAELLVKAKKMGFKIEQVGLVHEPRRFGNATGGNPLHIFRAFYDLFKLLPKL
ncbi:glycosyltransferase family 2 protein [Candidatus Daviesbacteria bacterium]|nr:glycosyltransferase family 2 protein [Candidatus Daviesbacteria bacterium]